MSVEITPVDTNHLHLSPELSETQKKKIALSPIQLSDANNSKDYTNMNEISMINKTTNPDTSMNTSNLELIKKL